MNKEKQINEAIRELFLLILKELGIEKIVIILNKTLKFFFKS